MLFASKVTKEIQRGDDRITIRKLSGKALYKAKQGRSIDQAAWIRSVGGEVVGVLHSKEMDQLAEKVKEKRQAATLEDRRKARNAEYDRDLVLYAGIVNWTCADTASRDLIDDLPEEDAQAIFEAILDLSLPALDLAEADAVPKGD